MHSAQGHVAKVHEVRLVFGGHQKELDSVHELKWNKGEQVTKCQVSELLAQQ